MSELTLPMNAEELMPHRLPMRLVDQVFEVEDGKGVIKALVRSDCFLVDEAGRLEDSALIELLAQSFAALKGYRDRRDGKPVRQGFLVGIKNFARLKSVQAGDLLRIEICTIAELNDFAVADGKIWCDSELFAHGEIKVWIK
ncbi:MAG: hypothetical protein JXK94_03705 [Deltaproteobacteria bacterium]|nr:hypothetical protein [Deltaproteobacteria bacterium]